MEATELEMCDRLAGAARAGADAGELTRLLAGQLGRPVLLLDPSLRPRCNAGWGSAPPVFPMPAGDEPARLPAGPAPLDTGGLAVPILSGGVVLGHLVVAGGDELSVAGYVATLFALALANERTTVELRLRHRAAIVESLVSGQFLDPHDAWLKARALGLADGKLRVGVVRWGSPDMSEHVLDRVEAVRAALHEAVPGMATRMRGTELVLLLPDGDDEALRAALTAALALGEPQLTCGLSGIGEHPHQVPELLAQAEHTAEIGARIGRAGEVVQHRELGIYRLLLQIGDLGALFAFAEDVLGPLVRYDATHRVGLVRTLSVYFSQRESIKRTARRLQVHTNTVSYRLSRIAQLTPLDLEDPDDRLLAHVAVKILEAKRAR